MEKRKRIVFATNNKHKLEEARQILSESFDIVSLSEIGCHDDIPETADTLEGNALIKARWVKERYGYDCFADDTGLMVDALDGAPGVLSARYAGEHCSPADNVAKMLREMQGKSDRKAHFATVVALIHEGETHCFEGRVEGSIAEAPHGDGGFGYDPIFVADETGKCFAEMSADDKNAISHRGRAMRKLRDFLCPLVMLIMMLCGVDAYAEQWRLHGSYDGNMVKMIDTPQLTYFLGARQIYSRDNDALKNLYGILFRYDKEGEEMEYLHSENLLSGDIPVAVEYNYQKKYLLIAYNDGDIDMLYDDGKVVNIPGLKIADSSLSKRVNGIWFDTVGNKAYLATDFGFVVLNDEKGVVDTSRILNKSVQSVVKFRNWIVLATEEGVYYSTSERDDLDSMQQIPSLKDAFKLAVCGNNVYCLYGKSWYQHVSMLNPEGTLLTPYGLSPDPEVDMVACRDGVLIISKNKMRWIDASNKIRDVKVNSEDAGNLATTMDGKNYWFSAKRAGISNKVYAESEGNVWTVKHDRFMPRVSNVFASTAMAYHPDYGMLVRAHGFDRNFGGSKGVFVETPDLLSGYKDMQWTSLSATYRNPLKGIMTDNPDGVEIDPNNKDHIYSGSALSGMLRYDIKDPSQSLHMSKPDDFMGGYGETGFVAVVGTTPEDAPWSQRCVFARPSFDGYGNLWTAYVNPDGESGSKDSELWVWTPEKRAASTGASNFREWHKIKYADKAASNTPSIKAFTTAQNRDYVLYMPGGRGESLLLLNFNGTPEFNADDKTVNLLHLYDQDGTQVEWELVNAIYEDPASGLVWAGYDKGVFTFKPSEIFANPQSVRRIKVPRNDGTNLADYLLNDIAINSIKVDGSGRKWFATSGAGLICTSADGATVLKSYTAENSPLPDNTVYEIGYNPATNSFMISTDRGLAELFLTGESAGGESSSSVKAYPNPVRPDFYGYVTIENLPEDTAVKITDAAGNTVKELGLAYSGSIEWDLTNRFHKRVPGGVYFIFATSGPDANSYDKVGKILVVE